MDEYQYTETSRPEEGYKEINLVGIFRQLFQSWRKILTWAGIAAVLGVIISVSIPDEYTVTTKMVPERIASRQNSSATALANMAGFNLGSAMTTEAVYPDMYPDIITSNPFVTDLFAVPVGYKVKEQIDSSDFYTYMRDTYRLPWWKTAAKLPGRFTRWVKSIFKGKSEPIVGYENLDLSRLTSEQSRVAGLIRKTFELKTDKNTSVISLSVSSQDPRVAARLADEVVTRLKQYVTDYRTEKARMNLEYYQKLYDEYQQKYFASQQRYASYVDSHQELQEEPVQSS